MEWIDSQLHVRFDAEFRAEVIDCLASDGTLSKLIDEHARRQDRIDNMDY